MRGMEPKKMMILIILILVLILLGAAAYYYRVQDNPVGDIIMSDPEGECGMAGGSWIEFPDSCTDQCEVFQLGEAVFCAQVLTPGCECGPDRCWDGSTCVNNPV